MPSFRGVFGIAATLCTLILSPLPAEASYGDIVFFGDSLIDTGNLYANSQAVLGYQAPASPPYFNGRLSNGQLWSEYFASGMGMPNAATAAVYGGSNYAVAGATLGDYGLPFGNIPQQLGGYLAQGNSVSASNLYVVMGGGNDIRFGLSVFQNILNTAGATAYAQTLAAGGNSAQAGQAAQAAAAAATPSATQSVMNLARAAADTLAATVQQLFGLGAKSFLLGNLPDLGHTPEAAKAGGGPLGTVLSQAFNAELNSKLLELKTLGGIHIDFLDFASLEEAVLADPAAYGFTNVTDECKPGAIAEGVPAGEAPCSTPDSYYYFDILHPSARAHRLIGIAALQLVPEPGTIALLAAALAAALLTRTRSGFRLQSV